MEIVSSLLVLPADVALFPVKDLPDHVREQMVYDDGDYIITRPRSRTPSRIIDSQTAALIQEFRTAKTIVDAVINFSQTTKTNAEVVLDAAFPMIKRFLDTELIVSVESQKADEIVHSFGIGTDIVGFTVLGCIQILEDTELYQVRKANGGESALKISRSGTGQEISRMFERESAILRHLDGAINPRLIDTGTFENRPYIAIDWCPGVHPTTIAEELRQMPSTSSQKELLGLCCAILEAYAHLHAQGVIHSDVHPRNVLVASDNSVKIIDYGLARLTNADGKLSKTERGGVGFFFEPEYARAIRQGHLPPLSTALGEQYSLAALLYFLITGAHYLDFSLEKGEMLRQISEDPILPFSKRSSLDWAGVEQLIRKALCKEPLGRFASVSDFAESLRKVSIQDKQFVFSVKDSSSQGASTAQTLLENVLQRVEISGSLFIDESIAPPTCSINYGSAGIAYALYRIACVRGDAKLLALADVWASRATRDIGKDTAFCNTEIEITPEIVGQISPYHTASGVYCAQAFISHAMGDIVSQQEAIKAFIQASQLPCENIDLTLGRSASLLGCALMCDIESQDEELKNLGDRTMRGIWSEINAFAPIRECPDIAYLGIAHGWAGIVYATFIWCQVSKSALPDTVEERLDQLAGFAEHKGRGIRWPLEGHRRIKRAGNYMSGWCHGSAGYIHLWTQAYQAFRDEKYLTLAEQSAWNTWEERGSIGSLCCGLAGQAYGLLNLYKLTGERSWLLRARQLADRAAVSSKGLDFPVNSLYKGEIGIAVLASDLSRPESSCMPFFEPEGWLHP